MNGEELATKQKASQKGRCLSHRGYGQNGIKVGLPLCSSNRFSQLSSLLFTFSQEQIDLPRSAMNYCGPRNAIPSCSATPIFGFGSNHFGSELGLGGNFSAGGTSFAPSMGFGSNRCGIGSLGGYIGFGSLGGRFGGFGDGSFGSLGSGGTTSTASLGVLQGVHPQCINQTPPNEVVVLPPAVILTFPGAVMSATPEPIRIGASAPCAAPEFEKRVRKEKNGKSAEYMEKV
ncbi:hypothetical protein JRQ81_009274 [Phrynocephalus forsythii]|uniref:Uncharacterized protein n=1 Tax=Phrynocephalus forsythii TaxID=171643 RepID=A0A9Q0X9K0_9SAUR|nr:hypothetical protein JRQ81_009274 [Phrynocephalus forsythii]